MARPALELADIFRRHGPAHRQAHRLPLEHLRLMRAIEICRTAELGGHVEKCGHCPYVRISYNSCRNRHCPKCQSLERARWLQQRQAELLPVEYFHVVFTLPEALATLAFYNKSIVYDLLFRAAAQALLTLARDPRHLGAAIGFFAVLHTWGQNLLHHPHLHIVVPAGGLSADHQRWVRGRRGFLLPVRVLSRLFRRRFLEALQKAFQKDRLQFFAELEPLRHPQAFDRYLAPLRKIPWVVYAKPPFGGPQQVLEYLGRYTHRVAISNQRLVALQNGHVSFHWKDYRDGRQKTMTLAAEEFLRRFLLHALPSGFQRIRYYGWMANRHRQKMLTLSRHLLAAPVCDLLPTLAPADYRDFYEVLTGLSLRRCPQCGSGTLFVLHLLPAAPTAILDSS